MIEYYISRVPNTTDFFKVAKFKGETEPDAVYFVTMKNPGAKGYRKPDKYPQMHCDCPNRRRDAHINDKHGRMVAKWLIAGEPTGFFDENGDFHGTDTTAADLEGPEDVDFGDTSDDEGDEEHREV